MYAVHVLEAEPPEGDAPVEWMLLTNRRVTTLSEACERVHWYSLRWRIEMYFKVLKSQASGLKHVDSVLPSDWYAILRS